LDKDGDTITFYKKTLKANFLFFCSQMRQILENKSEPAVGETQIAALTGGSRLHWAQTRQSLFFKGPNRIALDTVEKAAFVVCLDDVPYDFDKRQPEALSNFGRSCLYGKGYDRWFDKSFTLCVATNGRVRYCLFVLGTMDLSRGSS